MSKATGHVYRFGPFRLDVGGRLLWRGDDIVALTPKAVDALQVLVEASGRVVSKDDLLSKVWPDTFVEEANLSHQIYRIREALGEQADGAKYIETVPRRGYRFVARVDSEPETRAASAADGPSARADPEPATDSPQIASAAPVTPAETPHTSPGVPTDRSSRVPAATALVGAALLVLIATGYFLSMAGAVGRPAAPSDSIQSIAVLPFLPLAPVDHDEALELGMANAVITRLTNVPQITVRPTSAVLQYGTLSRDAVAAGRTQRVDAVVDGRMQRSGDRLRVTVQLLQVRDGRPVWAETFDQKAEDVFAIQDAISDRLVRALRVKLTGAEHPTLGKPETTNLAAYDAFQRGSYYNQTFAPGGFEKAVEYLTQAVTLDPRYARAWGALGFTYTELPFWALSAREGAEKARGYVAKALELDETVVEAHVALVNIKQYYDWDWAGAERECLRLQQIAPGAAFSYQIYGWYLGLMGRFDESLVQVREAQRRDPTSAGVNSVLVWNRLWAHAADEAIAHARRVTDLQPSNGAAHTMIAQAYVEQGRFAEAVAEFEAGKADVPSVILNGLLGQAYALAGRSADARRLLAELERTDAGGLPPPFQMAQIYLGLGDTDKAMEWLEKGYAARLPWMSWLKVDPSMDRLRSDPRFIDLLRRVGF